MRSKSIGVVLGVLVCASAGCGEAPSVSGEGDLLVRWEVAPRGCEAADVHEVGVRLQGEQGRFEERFACESGEGAFGQLPEGSYRIELVGLTSTGREVMEAPGFVVEIVGEEEIRAEPRRLSAMPAHLQVGWRFGDGRVCGVQGVERVELAVFDEADFELAAESYGCNQGEGIVGPMAAGNYTVVAWGIDAGGEVIFEGIEETAAKRGDVRRVEVVMGP